MTTTTRTATDKQIAFARTLGERIGSQAYLALLADHGVVSVQDLDVRQASAFIDALKAASQTARTRAKAERHVLQEAVAAATALAPGMHMRDGVAFKVYPARNGGHLLAKSLDPATSEWIYRGAASRFVTGEDRMTLDQAKEFGDAHGVCVCCARDLTNPESVALGIGPVCRRRYF